MSKELQERSDRIIKELKESLIPITEAIRKKKQDKYLKRY